MVANPPLFLSAVLRSHLLQRLGAESSPGQLHQGRSRLLHLRLGGGVVLVLLSPRLVWKKQAKGQKGRGLKDRGCVPVAAVRR